MGSGARVSEFVFTKNPNQKNNLLFFWEEGRRGMLE